MPPCVAPDVSATLSADGDAVVVFAVNQTLEEQRRPLDFSAFGGGNREVEVWTLADRDRAGEPDVTNGFADPERVSVARARFAAAAPRFEYRFPALSLTALRWRLGK